MERSFQSLLINGKYAVGDDYFSPLENSDEAYINRDMSFPALSFDKSMLSLLHYPYGSSYNTSEANLWSRKTGECSKEEHKWMIVEREEKRKRPKSEPSPEQFNFSPTFMFGQFPELQSLEQVSQEERRLKQSSSQISTTTTPTQFQLPANYISPEQFNFSPTIMFGQLPELQSAEQVSQEERRLKQSVSSISTTTNPTHFQLSANYINPVPLQQIQPPIPPPAKFSHREKARRRRNTVSDKTRSLQKVLPWDKKMDMATVYEETYKYIKFLQAQISVLESMPAASTLSSQFVSENPRQGNLYGGLGKLNRQQLLEVLVNSPAAQTILYSKGCCIYSLEQLILFKDISEKKFFISGSSAFT